MTDAASVGAPPKPRVAVVYHFFAHYRTAVMERMARSSKASFVFFSDDHDYENTIKPAELSAAVDARPCPTHQILGSVMWQPGLVRVALSREFDQIIVLGNPHWIATWIGMIAARLTGKRVLMWSHGFLLPPTGLKGRIRRLFYRLPHIHMFYGRESKQIAKRLGWDPKRLYVLGNSLDLDAQAAARGRITPEQIAECRSSLFADPSLPIAVCSARLQPAKRVDLLVRALAELGRQGLRANLIVIGDGPDLEHLKGLARTFEVAAHFEGACYDEDRLALLTMASTLTVCPGFVGLTAIQSMAFGVPVITNTESKRSAPEVEAIVPGRTGDLFTSGDVTDLVRVMRIWLQERPDRDRIRRDCIELVERFWSPDFQLGVLERATQGLPPDDGDYPVDYS